MLYDLQGNDIWYAWAWDEASRIEKEKPGWRKQKTVTLQFRKKLTEQSVQEVHQRIRTETTIARGTCAIFSGTNANDATALLDDEQTLQDAQTDPRKIQDLLRSCLTDHPPGDQGKESNGSGARGSQAPRSRAQRRVAILSSADREALGMIVMAGILLPLGFYKSIFPDIDWAQCCKSLARYGLVERRNQNILPSNEARKAILSDEFDSRRFAAAWIEKFESLKEYPDIALYLAAHYLRAAGCATRCSLRRTWQTPLYLATGTTHAWKCSSYSHKTRSCKNSTRTPDSACLTRWQYVRPKREIASRPSPGSTGSQAEPVSQRSVLVGTVLHQLGHCVRPSRRHGEGGIGLSTCHRARGEDRGFDTYKPLAWQPCPAQAVAE